MYVINQKAPHFPNSIPNGSMYFPENNMHPNGPPFNEHLQFSPAVPSAIPGINNHTPMQSVNRFINPQNVSSIRQHPIMTSTLVPQTNKNQKSTLSVCSIPDEVSMQYPPRDNFPSMNAPYKPRNTSIDSSQPIIGSQNGKINNPNLGPDGINTAASGGGDQQNILIHPTVPGNCSQPQRNKRTRPNANNTSDSTTVKENNVGQSVLPTHNANVIRPSTANMNVMTSPVPGIPQHKCLPPNPLSGNIPLQYNMVDMVPQQMRPRVPLNIVNSYGCSRPQIMEKNMTIFPPGPQSSPIFNNSPATAVSPFFNQIDGGSLPLPLFHLHSKLSKLPENDRLTFPVHHGNLWGPQTLRHGDQVTEVQFELNQDNLHQIMSRSDLDIVVTSFTHRDQFHLCHWPDFLELRINGHLLSLDTTVLQDLKVHMPCLIKRYCKLGMNILHFTVSKCVCCHLFHAYMVHRPTLQYSVETVVNKCTNLSISKTILSEFYSRNNSISSSGPEDVNNLCVVNLICPMSQTRISVPARTKLCKHMQVFDLLEFFKVQTRWPQYICPICRVKVLFNLSEFLQQIIVDELLKDILSKVDQNVKKVIIYPDSKWKPAPEMVQNNQIGFSNFCPTDNHDHDIMPQTIHQSPMPVRSSNPSPMSNQIKQQIYNEHQSVDKKSKNNHHTMDSEAINSEVKLNRSPGISSSAIPSPALSRIHYNNSNNTESLPHSETNLTGYEPSPPKRNKNCKSPYFYNDVYVNSSVVKFPNICSEAASNSMISLNPNVSVSSPESIRTPLSTSSGSSVGNFPFVANTGNNTNLSSVSSSVCNQNTSYPSSSSNITSLVSSTKESFSFNTTDPDNSIISSTTGSNGNVFIRPPTTVTAEPMNKQTSSGSSNPSSPPEFLEPHSATTNCDDDDNSSLHLQRLIGFIDEILSEEEEYVLDTQWASFTWPSADKSLDLLHLSDIEKLL